MIHLQCKGNINERDMLWNVDTRKIKKQSEIRFLLYHEEGNGKKKTFFIVCKEKTNFAKKLKIMKTSKNSFNIYFRLFFVAKTYVIQIMTSIAPA